MGAWSHAQYAGETERERERETQKPLLQKSSNSSGLSRFGKARAEPSSNCLGRLKPKLS